MWIVVLECLLIGLGLLLVAGTALSVSAHPHWFIRGWEFPRAQIAIGLLVIGIGYAAFFHGGGWLGWCFLAVLGAALAWQCRYVAPYTRLAPKMVQASHRPRGPQSVRVVMSNVQMDNTDCDRWLRVVRGAGPDVILALEVDQRWMGRLHELEQDYPHVAAQPQSNCYGMALFSKLPLIEPRIEFLVQDDVPSIHAQVELRSGDRITLHGLHPRPPEPIRDQDSAPRDAELVVVGRRVRDDKDHGPVIVAGDLNDVAWSRTTRLFLHLSGLLDPRRGRGFYNSFHAGNPLMRFPLDHVFHTNDFRLIDLRLLDHVGSDHFPVFIELSHEPAAEAQQPEPETEPGDGAEANEKIDRQRDSDD